MPERKQASRSLLQSQAEMLESIGDAFVVLDAKSCYQYVSTRAARAFGRKKEELVGRQIWKEIPLGADHPFSQACRRATETRKPLAIEAFFPPYCRWFENRIFPAPDGLVIFFQDITERKEIEAKVRKSARENAMLGASGEALLRTVDEENLLKEICRICVEIGGYRLAWVGYAERDEERSIRVIAQYGFHDGYLQALHLTWAHTPQGMGPTGTAIRTGKAVIAKDILVDPLYAPWRDEAIKRGYRSSIALPLTAERQVIGALNMYSAETDAFDQEEVGRLHALARDVAFGINVLRTRATEERMKDQLRESESRYRMLFEQNPAPMLIYERESLAILSVNEAFQRHYGYSMDQITAMKLPDLYPDDEKGPIAALIPSLHGYRNVGEWHHRKRDGSLITIIACSHDIHFEGRVGRVAVITDISDRKIAEDKVKSLNVELERRVNERTAQLETANRELESFSYSVSHDLRAPLRAISGFAEIITRRYGKDLVAEARHYFDNIIQASERMGRLIDDLLTYSRIGRRSLRAAPIRLGEVLTHVAGNFAPRLAETGGSLTVAPDPPAVHGDRSLLDQIFTNLIQNALTYHRKGVAPLVEIAWQHEGPSIVVSVRDNGIGIAQEYFDKIFDVFQRLHSDDEYPGTGIGLSTVKKAAELLGGKVWLESQEGKGSTFYVRLPKE